MTPRLPPRRRRRNRRPLAVAATVLVVFVAALVLWTRGLAGSQPVVVPPMSGPGVTPVAEGPASASPSPSGVDAGGGGAQGSPGVGSGLGTLPPDTIHSFTPGPHTVTVTATGDLGTVEYIFRGDAKATKRYNVRGPFRISERVSGATDLAAIGIQVSYAGTSGSCSVIVDGTTIVHYTAHGPYQVVGCVV